MDTTSKKAVASNTGTSTVTERNRREAEEARKRSSKAHQLTEFDLADSAAASARRMVFGRRKGKKGGDDLFRDMDDDANMTGGLVKKLRIALHCEFNSLNTIS